MCGIVGYVGARDAVSVIVDGLRKLEYRGYDSAGIAVVQHGSLTRRRSVGKLRNLEESLRAEPLTGAFGIGHTRWATHGRPSEENAHPHSDCSGKLVVVHNGIIENYLPLKARLAAAGHRFVTQTDTEVIAHLVESLYRGSLEEAARGAVRELEGIYALVLMHSDEPQRLVAARLGPPLVVGLGEGEHFLASDIPALLPYTRDFVFLDDGDVVTVTPDSMRVADASGRTVERTPTHITWDPVQAERGGYRHFMLKEIHEQPRAVRDTLLGRIGLEEGEVHLQELGAAADELRRAQRVMLLACGTSWHAALVGKYLLEQVARVPAEVDYGSEFRYRDPIVGPQTLAVAISQSGETADTLAALRQAKKLGALPVAICNVQGSMLTREAAGTLLTHAGPEIGVASTKAFTAQLVALALLTLHLGRLRGTLGADRCRELLQELARLPHLMEDALRVSGRMEEMSKFFAQAKDFLFLGRGINYPIALEGALKLKEISYIHAEGYPAGEMKHGPIALIDDEMPVVALVPPGRTYEKMLSNIQEVKARGGKVLAVTAQGDTQVRKVLDLGAGDVIVDVPPVDEVWSPLLNVLPLQLLAYHTAVRAGRDVDQPRNLAKSVTVE
ncbi:MAG TPA: glutamine--fructose-6-phosphate transaminase (isomerizing) [Vicinamibacteria bacterium]|nr:glutamine--fructose-6-phosphate transaminase (isomerizing) [Vicinamibacteria bacterium]